MRCGAALDRHGIGIPPRTRAIGSALVAALLTSIHFVVADAAADGRKVVLMMLATGLIFVLVIAVGQLSHWLRHRR